MRRVLITGAGGFIGRHCLPRLLADGYEVHAVSQTPRLRAEPHAPLRWHAADLLDAVQVSDLLAHVRPTHLLHLAWYAVPGKFWSSPENFRWVQASLNLFREFAACGGGRVVVAGSCAEYACQERGPLSEQLSSLAPATLYGACKHALHVMLEAFARQAGLSAAWGRIFFLYGPYEHPARLVAAVIRSLLRGEPARCSHGRQVRDFLYVEDVAGALVALLGSEVAGGVNIASGQGVAVKGVIYRVADALGRRDLIHLGARPVSPDEPPALFAAVTRLRDEVGWQPRHSLDSGLERTVEWWRRNLLDGVSENSNEADD